MALETKQRINISVSENIKGALEKLSKRDQVPVATKVLELLKKALEIEEDIVLDKLAQARDTDSAKYISHARAWR